MPQQRCVSMPLSTFIEAINAHSVSGKCEKDLSRKLFQCIALARMTVMKRTNLNSSGLTSTNVS